MSPKRRVPVGTPVEWIEDTDPEKIASALLAIDRDAAAQVALCISRRLAPELKQGLEEVGSAIERDPVGTLLSVAVGALKRR